MKNIIIICLSLLALTSCNPYKRILKDTVLTGKDYERASQFCYLHFKPIPLEYSKGKIDSSEYNKKIEDLTAQYNQIVDYYNELAGLMQKSDSTIELKDYLYKRLLKRTSDSLNGIIQAMKKGIPCPHRVDTIKIVHVPTLNNLNNQIIGLSSDLSKKIIENNNLKAEKQDLESKLSEAIKDKNKGWYFFYGLIGVIGLFTIVIIYFKVKGIFKIF